jgi:hypothetical protein
MIAKGSSGKGAGALTNYLTNDTKEYETVYQNLVSGEPKEMAEQMKPIQELNSRCENNTYSFVLSPVPEESNKMSNEDWLKMGDEFIKKMGLENNQAFGIVHREKEHKHMHIVANRIDYQGNAHKDNFIGKIAQNKGHEVAKDMGLTSVRDVKKQELEKSQDIRKEMKNIHDTTLKRGVKSFEDYQYKMASKGVTIHPTINKSDKLQGFRMEYKDYNCKASEVHRSVGLKSISENLGKDVAKTINPIKIEIITPQMALKLASAITKEISKSQDFGIGY